MNKIITAAPFRGKIRKKILKGYNIVENETVNTYKRIEQGIVGTYKHIENCAINGYQKIEDTFCRRNNNQKLI